MPYHSFTHSLTVYPYRYILVCILVQVCLQRNCYFSCRFLIKTSHPAVYNIHTHMHIHTRIHTLRSDPSESLWILPNLTVTLHDIIEIDWDRTCLFEHGPTSFKWTHALLVKMARPGRFNQARPGRNTHKIVQISCPRHS